MQDRDESERILKALSGAFDELANKPMPDGAVSRTIAYLPNEGEIVKLRGLDFVVSYVNEVEGKLHLVIRDAEQRDGAESGDGASDLTAKESE